MKLGDIVLYHLREGDGYNNGQTTAPAIVVNAWEDVPGRPFVNVQVFMESSTVPMLWKTSCHIGTEPGSVSVKE